MCYEKVSCGSVDSVVKVEIKSEEEQDKQVKIQEENSRKVSR